MRAYNRKRGRFSGFELTRHSKQQQLDKPVAEHELLTADEQWARIVDMELVPYPGLSWRKAVEADYSMVYGVLRMKAEAALPRYVLRRWSIDSTPDQSLDPTNLQPCWLANASILYGVESAAFAPSLGAFQKSAEEASPSSLSKKNAIKIDQNNQLKLSLKK